MISKYVIFFIFLAVPCWAEKGSIPTVDDAPPKSIPIQKKAVVEGPEETYTLDSTYRSMSIYPSNWGEAGIFRVRSAESLPDGTLTFGVGVEFFAVTNGPDFGSGPYAKTLAEDLFVGYAPTKQLTIAAMRRNSSTTFGDPPQLINSLGDIYFSAMYSFPISPSFAIAPIGTFVLASNFNQIGFSGNTISAGVGVAATYSLYPSLNVPLFVHGNVIYNMSQINAVSPPTLAPETFFEFSRFNTLTIAAGAELKLGDIIPFVEYYSTAEINSGLSFFNSPSKITVGARFTPIENKSLAFLLGADIGIGRGLAVGVPFTPAYQVLGQVSYTVGVSNTERKHYFTTKDVNIVDRKFVIGKNINFKVGSAELEPESNKLLEQIANVIKENNVRKLLIVGHTDSTATEDYNIKLSQDRAQTVKNFLVAHGVGEETLITQGYGKRKPKASNFTEVGRSINRRVEFYILE